MPKLELGRGLQYLTITLSACLLIGIGALGMFAYLKGKQNESNVEVLSIDSEVGMEIAQETEKQKVVINEKLKKIKKPIVDDNGYMSVEFMQLMESAKSTAEQRGNEASIIRAITRP